MSDEENDDKAKIDSPKHDPTTNSEKELPVKRAEEATDKGFVINFSVTIM
jgi:hypothetical protein